MAPSGLMFIAVDDPRTGRLKRRRSAARVVIDTVKVVVFFILLHNNCLESCKYCHKKSI